jgi:cyclopropane fatty-acyl-phospholipid synthase-like methyltransferase
MESPDYRAYWDRNIAKWGDYYLDISHGHEELSGPRWFATLYRSTIGRIERQLMAERYRRTIAFLDAHLKAGLALSDIGCGTGIFVVEALRRGASVNAIDFTSAAIDITRQRVAQHFSSGQVSYHLLDVQRQALPRSDVAIAMGLTPYLTDLPAFFAHALPSTDKLFCLFVDPGHWANHLRRAVPFLNVRGLQCYAPAEVDRLYARHGWKLIERRRFASGYIDLASR